MTTALLPTRRALRVPKPADLLLNLDFRTGSVRDLVSKTDLTISGTGHAFVRTRRGAALRLTSAGSGYISTDVAPQASGTVICLCRDKAGAGVQSPIFSNGFAADDEAISLIHTPGNKVDGNLFHSGGSVNFVHSDGRLDEFGVVGFSWGSPGDVISKLRNLSESKATSDWAFLLDTTRGVDMRLNVRSHLGASEFGDNEFGWFGLWSSPLHLAEMRQVSRQLLRECGL